jgi:hypothetical protein
MMLARPFHATAALLALTLYACGAQDKPKADADAGAAEDTSATASAPETNSGPKPIEVADIDRWEKGMAAELEAVHAASGKLKAAKTADDTLTAMMSVQENATTAPGAKAAGVDEERYNFIRSELSTAASYLAPWIGGVDTTMLSPEQRDEMRKDNQTQLEQMKDRVPPEVVAALAPRAPALRMKVLELVGARLKGVGA